MEKRLTPDQIIRYEFSFLRFFKVQQDNTPVPSATIFTPYRMTVRVKKKRLLILKKPKLTNLYFRLLLLSVYHCLHTLTLKDTRNSEPA
ncbi:hypothetical protein RclHR1_02440001 [Rhizophagus clarus]|uniref:Uncharacterized protein n=1 Tax=Rhizophagus clarus TaxID=94130 RepID=A0A2Z6QXB2_9GLOM|nr:hypothetical protein RclHR1_02440001 [Rhizophagus clarus]